MQKFLFIKNILAKQKIRVYYFKNTGKTEIKNSLPFFLENYFGPRGPVRVCFFSERLGRFRVGLEKKRVKGCL